MAVNRRRLGQVTAGTAAVFALAAIPAMVVYGPFGQGFMIGALTATLLGFLVVAVAEDSG